MTPPLTITIPVSLQTFGLVTSLLKHLTFLGPIPGHQVLFVADHGLSRETLQPILDAAKPIFPSGGSLIHTALPNLPPYPHAHNHRFETAARHIATNVRTPWLWLDPHCVPTRKGWIVELENEYRAHAHLKPILGQLLTPATHSTAQDLVSGTAVYPADIPKRMVQRLIARRDTDWEKSCADLTVPIAHSSKLIWVQAVNGTRSLPTPPPIVSLVHTAMAREFASHLQGVKVETLAPAPPAPKPEPKAVEKPPILPAPSRSIYYHSGDLGDIIYALSAIRLAGGGTLLLGPKSVNTPPPANPMREPVFAMLKPLLDAQPYLAKVAFSERHPGTLRAIDLNIFRSQWGDKGLRAKTGISTLARMHCHTLNVDEKFHTDEAWLAVPNPIPTGLFTVHRSSRYRNDDFPWKRILDRYRGHLLFVGLASEHADFQRAFGVKTAFWLAQDFLELARVIAGSLGFIGNQSFPNAIALACGQRVIQETWSVEPDCLLIRPNLLVHPFTDSRLVEWEKSPRIKPRLETKTDPIPEPIPEKDPPHPKLVDDQRRLVSTKPINGVIELGPCADAHGLGDTLTITPLAARLGSRAVMCLPQAMEKYACLFKGLCPVRITADYPVFRAVTHETGHRYIEEKLRMFGFPCENGKVVPVLRDLPEDFRAYTGLENLPPLIVHTRCAPWWASLRTRPEGFWAPLIAELSKHFHVLRESDLSSDLRVLASAYQRIGLYLGVNTGNWHLAMAVNCRCLVVDAEASPVYDPSAWRYTLPSCRYVGFDPNEILACIPWLKEGISKQEPEPTSATTPVPKRRARRRSNT